LYILVFPALFTAAMSLIDTADGVLMQDAYSWAFFDPLRQLWYNLAVTAVSVVVALFVGLVEAFALIGGKLGMQDGIWPMVAPMNDSMRRMWFLVVGMFELVWGRAFIAYWRVAASSVDSERCAPGNQPEGRCAPTGQGVAADPLRSASALEICRGPPPAALRRPASLARGRVPRGHEPSFTGATLIRTLTRSGSDHGCCAPCGRCRVARCASARNRAHAQRAFFAASTPDVASWPGAGQAWSEASPSW
jgi:hypothetical protein